MYKRSSEILHDPNWYPTTDEEYDALKEVQVSLKELIDKIEAHPELFEQKFACIESYETHKKNYDIVISKLREN